MSFHFFKKAFVYLRVHLVYLSVPFSVLFNYSHALEIAVTY
jgi:hypothetical protein